MADLRTISPMWRLRLAALLGKIAEGPPDPDTLWQLHGALVGLARGLDVPQAYKATLASLRAYGVEIFDRLAPVEGEDAIYAEGAHLLASLGQPTPDEVAEVRGN